MVVVRNKISFFYNNISIQVNILLLFVVVVILISCGSQLSSSDEVGAMFKNVLEIQDKMNTICSDINSDSNFNLQNHKIYGTSFCSEAPSSHVIDLNSVVEKNLKIGVNDTLPNPPAGEYVYGFRIEVYANVGLTELAQKATPTLKNLQNKDNSDSMFTIEMKENLVLDRTNITANAKLELTSTEAQNQYAFIQNEWKLYGKKIKNSAIVTMDTYKASDDSMLKEAHLMIAIIPHAGDIYLNIIGQIHLKDLSVKDLMSSALNKMVSDTLYNIKQQFNQ